MKIHKYILKSLIYYRRTHLGVVLGTAISTAILVGALIIGDSVRFSLKQLVFDRLGLTKYALDSGDRLFTKSLSSKLAKDLQTDCASLLKTKGVAIASGGQQRANQVQIVGVDENFDTIGGCDNFFSNLTTTNIIINERLAKNLAVQPGDEIVLRIEKLDVMPYDAPLSVDTETFVTIRAKIFALATPSQFGRFNLRTNQVEPYTIFLSYSTLSDLLGVQNYANVLLVAESEDHPLEISRVEQALEAFFTPEDAGLDLVELGKTLVEIRSHRIFLDNSIIQAVGSSFPNGRLLFTYFVNEFTINGRATPYSFITGSGPPIVPSDVHENDILINEWMAKDLNVQVGDQIEVSYFVVGVQRNLEEKKTNFKVHSVVPMRGIYNDPNLMPDFPGLADEENCRDWQSGFPIDYTKIRDKDEKYWDDYRGTPKAFITLKTAQKLWNNRFGNATAIRISDVDVFTVKAELSKVIHPASLGFVFRALRQEGLTATDQSVDFSQLFIGLSFFVIVAALLLTALLFVLSVEQRSFEIGLFRAVGYSHKNLVFMLLSEGAILAFLGSVLGGFLGIFYNQIVLMALKTIWQDIVGTSALKLYVLPKTVVTGIFIGIIIALLTIITVINRQTKYAINEVQRGVITDKKSAAKKPLFSYGLVCAIFFIVAFILLTSHPGQGRDVSTNFFITGFLLLISGIALSNIFIRRSQISNKIHRLTVKRIGLLNNSRKRSRSLTLIGLFASGVFIIFTVGANRHDTFRNVDKRSSGTGGFALFAQTSIPLLQNLNTQKGKKDYNLDDELFKSVEFVSFRVLDGDDASCLNLNRISQPKILGVNPEELNKRQAFTFIDKLDEVDSSHPWLSLKKPLGENTLPAIADMTVITWGLGLHIGDTLSYINERGENLNVVLVGGLANSIFQGHLIVDEQLLLENYPSQSGYSLFLVDVPKTIRESVISKLTWGLQDFGIQVTLSADRLAQFAQIENTYLSIFLILGGFGLVIGSLGIGIVVVRNVMERRGEIALLRAIGFEVKIVIRMLLVEHLTLFFVGTLCGFFASFFAVLPAILSPGKAVPFFTIFMTLIFILVSGFLWVVVATKWATRGNLLVALRQE